VGYRPLLILQSAGVCANINYSTYIAQLCDNADRSLFRSALRNPFHTLHPLLPPHPPLTLHSHSLRPHPLPFSMPLRSAVVVFLFLAGLWFTESIKIGPNFHQKLTLAAPTIGYMRLMLRLMLTGPAGLC